MQRSTKAASSWRWSGSPHWAPNAAALLRRLGVTERARPRSDAPLSRRESDVLELLARGLTNREIAERLVISPKTAEHHVSQILGKLGLRSRAEAAAWLARGSADAADGPAARAPDPSRPDHVRGTTRSHPSRACAPSAAADLVPAAVRAHPVAHRVRAHPARQALPVHAQELLQQAAQRVPLPVRVVPSPR